MTIPYPEDDKKSECVGNRGLLARARRRGREKNSGVRNVFHKISYSALAPWRQIDLASLCHHLSSRWDSKLSKIGACLTSLRDCVLLP